MKGISGAEKNHDGQIYLNINFKGSVIQRKLLKLISDYV